MAQQQERDREQQESGRRPTLWQVAHSVLAAMFGVQSEKNRTRDMTQGRPGDYIVVGLIATVLFIAVLMGLVQLILHLAR